MTGVGGQCSQSVCFKSKLNVRREELGIAKARKLRFFVMLFFCCCFFAHKEWCAEAIGDMRSKRSS